MPSGSLNAIGRLGGSAGPWFGVERRDGDYRLVFGEEDGSVRSPGSRGSSGSPESDADAERDLLLALIAFFQGEAPAPPPELEMTQWEAAEVVAGLAERYEDKAQPAGAALAAALDAIDDGLPTEVVTAALYEALEAVSGAGGSQRGQGVSALRALEDRYRSLGRGR